MNQRKNVEMGPERRSEPREILDHYFSVEFSVSSELPVHQFRVRDVSPSGIGILVNEGSAVLEHLEVGNVLEMKYNPANASDSAKYLKTEIRHITKMGKGRYKGHYLIGMLIIERPKR